MDTFQGFIEVIITADLFGLKFIRCIWITLNGFWLYFISLRVSKVKKEKNLQHGVGVCCKLSVILQLEKPNAQFSVIWYTTLLFEYFEWRKECFNGNK